ncbi:NAD-dependent epimerase/dehydratase family protein [Micromonospora ureilytica]|uniref:NAD-dependent epimerase/dehydratase family protein n=1 Tax=Micromonospora ureilytica TaxID=709868 RepID=UPI0033F3D859
MNKQHGGGGSSDRPVVVTGSSGFIGSHVVDQLSAMGRRVVGIDRRPPVDPVRPGVRYVTNDLLHLDITRELQGASTVVHLAALPGVRPSWEHFDQYVQSNIGATRRLLEACAEAGVRRLVIASSSSVYGDRNAGPMREDQAPAPVSPYAVTKLAAEQLALAYAHRPETALTTIALRFFTVYGPGQRPDMLISRIIDAALRGAEIQIYGDGSQRRDFIFVHDVVRAIVAAMDAPGGNYICNVGTGSDISVSETIALLAKLIGREPITRMECARPGDVDLTRADSIRAAELLDFRASVPFHEGLLPQIEAVRATLT